MFHTVHMFSFTAKSTIETMITGYYIHDSNVFCAPPHSRSQETLFFIETRQVLMQ